MFEKVCGIDPYILENINSFDNLVLKCRSNNYICLVSTSSKSLLFIAEEELGYGPNRILVKGVPKISQPLPFTDWRINNGFLYLPTKERIDLTAIPKTPTMALVPINFYPGHSRKIIHRKTKNISQELERTIHDFISSLKNTNLTTDSYSAVSTMVGLGPGLYPMGDRILCGIILTSRALSYGKFLSNYNLKIIIEVKKSLNKTTEFSASFLSFAIEGRVNQTQANFFHALSKDYEINVESACNEILLEEFSGFYFLLGVRIALDILRTDLPFVM